MNPSRTLLPFLFLILLLPTVAPAQTDDGPDEMGIFLASGYPLEEGYVPAITPFTIYALLLDPTSVAMSGFEFGYDHVVQGGMEGAVLRLSTNWPPGTIPIIDPAPDPFQGSYSLALPGPVPLGPVNVLMSWDYMLMAPDIVVELNLTGAENPTVPGGLPGYVTPEGIVPCGIAQTCFGTGSRVNAFCPLATEPVTWGTLKGLYR